MEIRMANQQDAKDLLAIYAPYVEETAITFEYNVPSIEEFQNRIRNMLKKYPYLVAQEGKEILGYAYAAPFHKRPACDWAVEISIYIKRNSKRQGIGRKLYRALESMLKKQGILNVTVSIAYSEQEDPYLTKDSVVFHQAMGYHLVGIFHQCGYKFGRWYHLAWMEKMLGEHQSSQEPVLGVQELEPCL